ncbi:MAG: PEFG-CTERM sorting domain-containing protein, partial [Nitrosopumilus sp.]|nr:PEFG-CTERM sorting domain-containing protein [Nitrosopumilus sp.]NNL52497.1 PEFG-CTERM sorting domain-containing protein [Nitrosopumilus sp.]
GAAAATGMMSDGTVVSIWASEPTAGERMEITIEFKDMEHVNYDIIAMQNDEEVLPDAGAHEHAGTGVHMTAPLSSSDPVDITVTLNGYGLPDDQDNWTGPIGEEVVFSNVVPEFGTVAMMILAVAIISIVAVTAKSRVIPRF